MHLYLKAELEGISAVEFPNSPQAPYEFEFSIECTKCHELHPNPVSLNTFEEHEMPGSKGVASYVGACKFCKCTGSISIAIPKKGAQYTTSGERQPLLDIESRGFNLVKFTPVQPLAAPGFDEVDLVDGEWYDYDDNAGCEVSITNVEWSIEN